MDESRVLFTPVYPNKRYSSFSQAISSAGQASQPSQISLNLEYKGLP
jgi:hypothetical protein